jgi:hydrogenase expression/formation protein HypE
LTVDAASSADARPGRALAIGGACPAPHRDYDRVQLGHGSGGKMSARLLQDLFLPRFANPILELLGDGAVVGVQEPEVVVSTDSFVVNPLEFPGGNIGDLAVNGTLNDLAMMGATPRFVTAGFILEEGLELDVLERILDAMARAVDSAGVTLVTGDTKVVERGKADGLFINTTGIGVLEDGFRPDPSGAQPGDVVLVSGPLGRHGIAVMAVREGLAFDVELESDTASLSPLVHALRRAVGPAVRTMRDPTRGGLASALNEIAASSSVGVELVEHAVPVPGPVAAACEMLGLDPLYVANEGVLTAILAPEAANDALAVLRDHPLGQGAAVIGRVVDAHPGMVVLRTGLGGTRVVDMLPGDQLPRIC